MLQLLPLPQPIPLPYFAVYPYHSGGTVFHNISVMFYAGDFVLHREDIHTVELHYVLLPEM
jgi:hypothetical protein